MTKPNLDRLSLDKGRHDNLRLGVSLLEAVAWWAGEAHTDDPACVSPVLAAYGRRLNDLLSDRRRQELRWYIPQMAGTAGDDLDDARGYLALDWLIRTHTPAWLDLAGLTVEAAALRDLPRIVDLTAAQAAGPVVQDGAAKARAAGAAAWDKAKAAGENRDAAGFALMGGAWEAVRMAIRTEEARAASTAASGVAAWDAVWDAASIAIWDAGRREAGARVAPVIDQLETSAIALLGQMTRPA